MNMTPELEASIREVCLHPPRALPFPLEVVRGITRGTRRMTYPQIHSIPKFVDYLDLMPTRPARKPVVNSGIQSFAAAMMNAMHLSMCDSKFFEQYKHLAQGHKITFARSGPDCVNVDLEAYALKDVVTSLEMNQKSVMGRMQKTFDTLFFVDSCPDIPETRVQKITVLKARRKTGDAKPSSLMYNLVQQSIADIFKEND